MSNIPILGWGPLPWNDLIMLAWLALSYLGHVGGVGPPINEL